MAKLAFTKMQGTGNDYIYVDCIDNPLWFDPAVAARELSRRRFAIGADGLVLMLPGESDGEFRMRIFNADGSEAMMCGNASRCVGKYLFERGRTRKTTIRLETNSGIKELTLELSDDRQSVEKIAVDMGVPDFSLAAIPADLPASEWIAKPLIRGETAYEVTLLSMGNPHAVVFVQEELLDMDIKTVGQTMEQSGIFPQGVNTEFVRVCDRKTLEMRVWERGSGETLSCGSGACAAAVVAMKCDYADRVPITVCLPGGDLEIQWKPDGRVIMTGEAQVCYDGVLEWNDSNEK